MEQIMDLYLMVLKSSRNGAMCYRALEGDSENINLSDTWLQGFAVSETLGVLRWQIKNQWILQFEPQLNGAISQSQFAEFTMIKYSIRGMPL